MNEVTTKSPIKCRGEKQEKRVFSMRHNKLGSRYSMRRVRRCDFRLINTLTRVD